MYPRTPYAYKTKNINNALNTFGRKRMENEITKFSLIIKVYYYNFLLISFLYVKYKTIDACKSFLQNYNTKESFNSVFNGNRRL